MCTVCFGFLFSLYFINLKNELKKEKPEWIFKFFDWPQNIINKQGFTYRNTVTFKFSKYYFLCIYTKITKRTHKNQRKRQSQF